MAETQVTGAFSSYDAIGNREDLSGMIFDVTPYETPILRAIKKNKATNRVHSWQTDALTAPSATNAHIEGADADPTAPSATVLLNNYTQILKDWAVVTGTQQDGMNPAGRKKEMAYQLNRRLREIKTDLEMSMFGANNPKVTGDDSTAREMASIEAYLDTNTSAGATGEDPSPADGTDGRTDGTQRPLVESLLETVLQSCYDEGADPKLMVCGSFNKGVISDFDGGQTRYQDTSDSKLVTSIDVYKGDFHTLKVIPSRHVRSRNVLLLDPEYLAFSELRPLRVYDLAKTGDSYRKEIVWEGTLEVCNEKAHGIIADLTTS